MIKIRAFRATEHFELCKKFIEGHKRVLGSVGIKEVTSSNNDWAYNPGAFVILVESDDEKRVLGGARIHVAGGNQPLPIEEAAGYLDPGIYDLIKRYGDNGIGEVCGLWNSVEDASLGIGSIFLIRAALAISNQIGLDTMLALCSPFTTGIASNYGFLVEKSVGKEGTFYYPKDDLLATVVLQKEARNLSNASELETERIFDLRKNPVQITMEKGRKNQLIKIDYDLLVATANPMEFRKSTINQG
ncbi:MAG: hypothetical protein K8R85_14515 [Bacteroidetes bacterium]|nr:hypothetical protein [Bacteroidota bacterium]